MDDGTKLFLSVLLIVVIVIVGPLLTIWAINTLFPVVAIPYTLSTWFAALCLGGGLKLGTSSNS